MFLFAIVWRIVFGNGEKKELPQVMSPYAVAQPPAPTSILNGNVGQMVEHSRQTGAHIQVVEKVDINNGNLTAERHVKISQPYVQPVQSMGPINPDIPFCSRSPQAQQRLREYFQAMKK